MSTEMKCQYNYTNHHNYDITHPFFKWNHMYENDPKKFCNEYDGKTRSYKNVKFDSYADIGDNHPSCFYKSKLSKPIYFRNCEFNGNFVVFRLMYSEIIFVDCKFNVKDISIESYEVQFINCDIKCSDMLCSNHITSFNNVRIKAKEHLSVYSPHVSVEDANLTTNNLELVKIDHFIHLNMTLNYKSIGVSSCSTSVREYFNVDEYNNKCIIVVNESSNLTDQFYSAAIVILNCNITRDYIRIQCEQLYIKQGIVLKARRTMRLRCDEVIGKGFKLIAKNIDITKTNLQLSYDWDFECTGKFLFNNPIVPI